MRYLKLFFILCCLPLLAEEMSAPIEPVTVLTETATPSVKEEDQPAADLSKDTESYETAFMKTVVALVGLLLLIFLTVWMLKKISRGRISSFNYQKSIKVLEKRPLSPKSILYLVEVSGKQVLIAESQFEVRAVATLESSETAQDL